MYTEDTLQRHKRFFDSIIETHNLSCQGNIIPIIHILPDAIPFLYALQKISTVPFIIPKPKSINLSVRDSLDVEIMSFSRQDLNTDIFYKKISGQNQKTVFIDIGGYFSKSTMRISEIIGKKFCGIVEDTENGLQKYLNEELNFPLLSVARSPLKENEDYMVGTAIGYSIERILREHNILMNGLKFGVIGYGKIGRSVANTAKNKQAFVLVSDIDPIRLTHAYSHGYNIRVSSELISQSDILCVAAGKVSLKAEDFKNIKNGCWIFSVTSSDDSLDLEWLENNYDKQLISDYVYKYYKDKHYFYIVNDGDTINFIHGTTVGDFILLVQAELLISASKLLSGNSGDFLQELDKESRESICSIWLKYIN